MQLQLSSRPMAWKPQVLFWLARVLFFTSIGYVVESSDVYAKPLIVKL